MAGSKKRQHQAGSGKSSPAPEPVTVREAAPAETVEPALVPQRFSLKAYVLMNVLFDAFCLAQLFVVRLVLKEEKGLFFFFGLLMVSFLLVSVFDYCYDRKAGWSGAGEDGDPKPAR